MAGPYTLRITVKDALVFVTPLDEHMELGRQKASEPAPYCRLPAVTGVPARLLIAPQEEKENVSRKHLSIVPLEDGRVQISNHSRASIAMGEQGGNEVAPDGVATIMPPLSILLVGRLITIVSAGSDDLHGVYALDER